MRVAGGVGIFAGLVVAGCAQIATQETVKNAKECLQAVKSTEDAQLLRKRLWQFDDTDTAEKLSDPTPLTKPERDAIVRHHNRMVPCREIVINHDNRYAAWETPYWQEFFARGDAVYVKLASGELPVGMANRLSIENQGKFQTDVSRGHADAVRVEEAQRQRAAEALIQASAQISASQPRMTTTNCNWIGNQLNCTSFGR
jgi:hypothetical protein